MSIVKNKRIGKKLKSRPKSIRGPVSRRSPKSLRMNQKSESLKASAAIKIKKRPANPPPTGTRASAAPRKRAAKLTTAERTKFSKETPPRPPATSIEPRRRASERPRTPAIKGPSVRRPVTSTKVTPRRRPIQDSLTFVFQGLESWWQDYLNCLTRFQQSASGRNVHDLRVAIRRLNTVFDLIDRFNPDNMVRRARGKLKDQLSALSTLRDAHVEMVRMRGFLKEFPEMKPLHAELLEKEAQQLKAVKKIGWKADRKFIETAYNRATLRLNARRAASSDDTTRKIIDASIDVLFDNLSKRLEKVAPTDYASIHRVRLAFRPLRYTLELLQPVLGLERKQLRTAASLARVMGHIQDLEVLMKDLIEFNWGKENILSAVVEIWLGLERQKIDETQRFVKWIPKFGTIWRPIIQDQHRPPAMPSKTLFILRHGIAVPRGDPEFPLDSDRPLTSKGLKRMRRIASGMRRNKVRFEAILSSPYRRALESAFVVAREYQAGEALQTSLALRAEVLPEEVIRTLTESYSSSSRLLLVGHEPQLSALVSTLTSGSASARPLLKKGGLCRVDVDRLQNGKCATLVWLLTPKQMMNMA